ncbi:MAG: hypothetical protein M3O22_00085 [Pseudomonadota bacterium]|nr:hypothetical protein [Pseudomonadota bacterium]
MKKSVLVVAVLSLLVAAPAMAVAKKTDGSALACVPAPVKAKGKADKALLDKAGTEADTSTVTLTGTGLYRIVQAQLMTPSAGYSWAVAGVRHQKDSTVLNLSLEGPGEGTMGAQVITPVSVSVPVALRPQTKTVVVRLNRDYKWGNGSYTCTLP